MSLTAKQRLFVAEYVTDFNAAAAARRAGYSEKTADRIGHENLRKLEIRRRIDEVLEERLRTLGVSSFRVLEELSRLGFSNMMDYLRTTADGEPYVDLSAMTREQAAAIHEVTVEDFPSGRGKSQSSETPDAREVRRVKFKLADKKGPLELLGKYLKLFVERRELTGKGGGPIETKNVEGTAAEIREIDRHISELDAEIAALEAQEGGAREG